MAFDDAIYSDEGQRKILGETAWYLLKAVECAQFLDGETVEHLVHGAGAELLELVADTMSTELEGLHAVAISPIDGAQRLEPQHGQGGSGKH